MVLTSLGHGLSGGVINITPAIAGEWLKSANAANRPVSRGYSNQYISDMQNGRWILNGEPIVFDESGMLVNGHHRLGACVKAGAPFLSLVLRGVKTKTFDRGNARTPANEAHMAGVKNAAHYAAASRLLLCLEAANPVAAMLGGEGVPSREAILADIQTRPDFDRAIKYGTNKKFLKIPPSVVEALFWQFSRINAQQAEEFFEAVHSGVGLGKGDPRLVLRNQLATTQRTMRQLEVVALVSKAWNAWRAGTVYSAANQRFRVDATELVALK